MAVNKIATTFLFSFVTFFTLTQASEERPSWHQYDPQTKTQKWILTPEKKVEWVFDEVGNRIQWKDWAGVTQYTYDNKHRIIETLTQENQKTAYKYSPEGYVSQISYPSGEIVDYTYYREGFIETIVIREKTITFEYDLNKGLLLKKHLPNGITTEYQYDPAQRLIAIIHSKSSKELIAHFSFEYDAMNNLTFVKRITEKRKKNISYRYDKLYRLIEANCSDGSFEKYSYDTLGNRLTKEDGEIQTIYKYNEKNQLISTGDISFFYDTNGNLIKQSSSSGEKEYFFNELNQLIGYKDKNHSVQFTYNARGERLTKTVNGKTIKYAYEDIFPVFHLLEENSEKTKKQYFYAHNCLGYSEDEKLYYYLEGYPGNSVGFIVDEKGNVKEEIESDSFGVLLSSSENTLQFNGEITDKETGLIFLRTRYYNPSLGRFISSDQFPANKFNPQTLHPYVYVNNNPLNFQDPMGTYLKPNMNGPKAALWAKGAPIWQKEDPLPPEGFMFLAICARKRGIFVHDPNRNEFFRGFSELEGHVWIEVIDSKGNHFSRSAHIGEQESKDQLLYSENPLHPDIATNDHITYSHDQDTIKIAYCVPSNDGYLARVAAENQASKGYNLIASNCVHASNKGAEAAKIDSLFYKPKFDLSTEEPSLSLLPHLTPSGVYSSIERFIAPYVKMEEDRQMQIFQKTQLIERMNWQQNSPNINMGLAKVGFGAPFTTPPRSSLPKFTPTKGNFGGVCLSKKAELDLALQEIYGAVFDEATGQLYVLGKKPIKLPEMPIDHLAVAFQSIYGLKGNHAEDPAVSIEPISDNKMIVKYFGATFGTEFGRILFEADLTLKKLGMGLIPCSVPGFLSDVEINTILRDKNHPQFSVRTWIVPEIISLRQSEDGSSMVFDQVKMRCLVENKVGNRVVTDPAYQASVDFFTNHYDTISKQYPIFNEIKLLGQISGVVKWMKENNIPLNLSFFETYSPIARETPTEINNFVVNFQTSTGQLRSIKRCCVIPRRACLG